MSPQDNLQVTVTIMRGQRERLAEIIQQNPEVFLEFEIKDDAPPYPNRSIFINYRRSDSEDVCGRIYDRLVEDFGAGTVFKDLDDIPPGVDFRLVLEREVAATDVMLAVIGQNWLNRQNKARLHQADDFVRFEIETALKRGIPVIPVLVQRRVGLPQKRSLPPSLQDLIYRNAREVRPDPDFHHDMDRLIEGIRAIFDAQDVADRIMP